MAGLKFVFPVHDRNARDRFGLPLNFTLLEGATTQEARISATKQLVLDATRSVINQVGRKEARLLFMDALKSPKSGRAADRTENGLLLAAYDRAIASGVKQRFAASHAAREMAVHKDDPESIARHIRTLVKQRNEQRMKEKERRESVRGNSHRTLLSGAFLPETDK